MSTTDPLQPSCGQGSEETSSGYSDLSGTFPDIFQGQSMAGGNTVTETPPPGVTGAQGTASEATATNLTGDSLQENHVADVFGTPESDSDISHNHGSY